MELSESNNDSDIILIVILVRNKSHTLPLFLHCIRSQTWPKTKTAIYIRCNNCSDNSEEILRNWVNQNRETYGGGIYEDYTDIDGVEKTSHEIWTSERFFHLGKIRQESVEYAKKRSDIGAYFVCDADNFIRPETIEKLWDVRNIGIVAPLLKRIDGMYANYHYTSTESGYYDDRGIAEYVEIFNRGKFRGLIECDVVHCTYMIARKFLDTVSYQDGTGDHEYVIVSRNWRNLGVHQYMDTRFEPGYLTLEKTETNIWLEKEYFTILKNMNIDM